jgi:ADP-ribose pyrophosphatase YjhB (NUDIX family)
MRTIRSKAGGLRSTTNMGKRNSHCSYCGTAFAEGAAWPRTCACGQVTYVNPTPVSVVLLPVDDGLLTIRRTIPPHIGKLALPGGYVGLGETWQEAGARELLEETGITIDSKEIEGFGMHSADTTILLFGLAKPRRRADLPAFVANSETSELAVAGPTEELAFPLHTQVLREYFARRKL